MIHSMNVSLFMNNLDILVCEVKLSNKFHKNLFLFRKFKKLEIKKATIINKIFYLGIINVQNFTDGTQSSQIDFSYVDRLQKYLL